jgi:hypothetical protein
MPGSVSQSAEADHFEESEGAMTGFWISHTGGKCEGSVKQTAHTLSRLWEPY